MKIVFVYITDLFLGWGGLNDVHQFKQLHMSTSPTNGHTQNQTLNTFTSAKQFTIKTDSMFTYLYAHPHVQVCIMCARTHTQAEKELTYTNIKAETELTHTYMHN